MSRYIVEIGATRDASHYDQTLKRQIAFGASPRGTIALERCARPRLAGRARPVTAGCITIALDVAPPRASFEADGASSDDVISRAARS